MGTWFLSGIINTLLSGAGAEVGTIFSWPLGVILMFVLAFAIIGLVWHKIANIMNKSRGA